MKRKTAITTLFVTAAALASLSGVAQDRGRDRAQVDRDQQVDRDRTFDRDRTQDRDRVDVPERDRDRDQDRTYAPDFSNLRDQDIFGHELLTARERNQYRQQLGEAATAEAREQIRAEHQARVQARANEQGLSLAQTSEGPIYGGNLMTAREREQHREQLRLLEGADRNQFLAQHREMMQQRAREQGVTLDD